MLPPRVWKYAAFPVIASACGFLAMKLATPVSAGAHDGGFLGMAFGLLIGQVIFACLLVERWRVPSALAVWILAAVSTWTVIGVLMSRWGAQDDLDNQAVWGWAFFLVYTVVSVGCWECVHRLVRARPTDQATRG
jgi:hypothetical protein